MTMQFILIIATAVYLAVLVVAVYFSRATARRVIGALMGGGAVALVGVGIEALAHTLGWWRYPSIETPCGPPLMYPALVLLFAVLALVGWRATRRFGWHGQVVFLAAVTVVGTLRDYLYAAKYPEWIVFAPGILTVFVDAACWASLVAVAQAVMCLVAGPAQGDSLAREPRSVA